MYMLNIHFRVLLRISDKRDKLPSFNQQSNGMKCFPNIFLVAYAAVRETLFTQTDLSFRTERESFRVYIVKFTVKCCIN